MAVLLLPPLMRLAESALEFQLQPLVGIGDASVSTLSSYWLITVLLGLPPTRTPLLRVIGVIFATTVIILFPWLIRHVAFVAGRDTILACFLGWAWLLVGLKDGETRSARYILPWTMLWTFSRYGMKLSDSVTGFLIGKGIGSLVQLRLSMSCALLLSFQEKIPRLLVYLLLTSLLIPSPAIPSSVVAHRETQYGFLSTVILPDSGVVVLRLDKTILGARYLKTGDSAFASFYFPTFGRFALPNHDVKEDRRALLLGLGIGVDATELLSAEWTVYAVELVKDIPGMAEDHFGMPRGRVNVTIGDAWSFLDSLDSRNGMNWDLAILDIFSGSPSASADFSTNRLKALHSAVGHRGILVVNLVARPLISEAVYTTFASEFEHVRIFSESMYSESSLEQPPPGFEKSTTNLVVFCSTLPIYFEMPKPSQADFDERPIMSEMMELFLKMEILPERLKLLSGNWDEDEAKVVRAQHAEAMGRMFDQQFWMSF
jgi:hypothetical protein